MDNVLCGHSRNVRELPLVLFLLFADIMQAHNRLLLIIPRVASSAGTHLHLNRTTCLLQRPLYQPDRVHISETPSDHNLSDEVSLPD